jgi:hypothetical protein
MAIDWQELTDDILLDSGLQETVQYPTGTAPGYINAIVCRNGLNTMRVNARGVDQVAMNEIEIYVSATDIPTPLENQTLIGVKRSVGSATYSTMTVRKVIHSDGSFKLGLDP